jgi:hypothetical protein
MKKKRLIKDNTEQTKMKEKETDHPDDGLQETGPQRQGEEMTGKEQRGRPSTSSKKNAPLPGGKK